jgi:ArsR family transcriptional regulator, cadmium/lead-responsive transcriptional repressor
MTDDLDAVFAALADPTRRHVLEHLTAAGPATPTELAAVLPITRQAVSKHLASLGRAGLVRSERCGREVRYAASGATLTEALGWLARVGSAWDTRLETLRTLLDEA